MAPNARDTSCVVVTDDKDINLEYATARFVVPRFTEEDHNKTVLNMKKILRENAWECYHMTSDDDIFRSYKKADKRHPIVREISKYVDDDQLSFGKYTHVFEFGSLQFGRWGKDGLKKEKEEAKFRAALLIRDYNNEKSNCKKPIPDDYCDFFDAMDRCDMMLLGVLIQNADYPIDIPYVFCPISSDKSGRSSRVEWWKRNCAPINWRPEEEKRPVSERIPPIGGRCCYCPLSNCKWLNEVASPSGVWEGELCNHTEPMVFADLVKHLFEKAHDEDKRPDVNGHSIAWTFVNQLFPHLVSNKIGILDNEEDW